MTSIKNYTGAVCLTVSTLMASLVSAHDINIACVQAELNALGHNAGTSDGVIGRQTRAALAGYRAAENTSAQLPEISADTAQNWCVRIARKYPEHSVHAIKVFAELANAAAAEGETQNPTMAARWFGYGAEAGDPIAARNLANMYENGIGVTQSEILAAKWYRVAATGGDAEAQYIYGNKYAYGEEQKAEWLAAAEAQGYVGE